MSLDARSLRAAVIISSSLVTYYTRTVHTLYNSFWSATQPNTRPISLAGLANKKLIRRWDSERELSLRRVDDIVHVLQNTIDFSCINSATDRRGYVLERMCLQNSVK